MGQTPVESEEKYFVSAFGAATEIIEHVEGPPTEAKAEEKNETV